MPRALASWRKFSPSFGQRQGGEDRETGHHSATLAITKAPKLASSAMTWYHQIGSTHVTGN
jgi:hypothetical protein